ncbi:WD40-repeat-containing domain protein [Terfezia claveryi]|nr:WD40-repeat-containing domain protein [Terfezia claveryi]
MAPNLSNLKTTFEVQKVIQPFYTGGKVALDKDSRFLVTTLDEDVLIVDYESGDELARMEGDGESVTTLALNPQATLLAICSRSQNMRIYSLVCTPPTHTTKATVAATLLRSVKAHSAPVHIAETDSTGTLLATGGTEGLVKVWDMKGGFVTHNFRGHGGVISALKFYSPTLGDGKTGPAASGWKLASGADDTKIRVWDLLKRRCVAVLESHVSVVRGLDWSDDGRVLVSGSRDKVVCLWDTKSWKLRNTIPVLEEVETVGFLAPGALKGYANGKADDTQVIYAGGQRNHIRLWDSSSGKEITTQSTTETTYSITDIIYNKAHSNLVSIHSDQAILIHCLTIFPSPLPILRTLTGNLGEVIDAQFLTSTDSLLALSTNSEDIRIVTTAGSFGDVAVLKGHEDIVICLDRDPSGTWLASGAKDNDARLWKIDADNNSFTCYVKFTGHAESIGAIALPRASSSSSGVPKFLLTGSQDRTVKKWDIPQAGAVKKAPRAVYTRKAHDKDINSIDVSPDDTLFASASQDKTVKIWSLVEGEVLGVLRGHRRGVWSVRFAPLSVNASILGGEKGGRVVVTGSADKTIRLWTLADYSCLKTFEGHANSVLKTIWIHGGQRVASAGGEGLVKVWDVKSGECVSTLDNHEDRVWVLTQSTKTITIGEDIMDEDGAEDAEDEGEREEGGNSRPGATQTAEQLTLLSGSSDSIITFWLDTTLQTQLTSTREATLLVEQEQQLSNYIHQSDYRSAIVLALSLNHPGRLLSLFTSVFASPDSPQVAAVEKVLSALDDTQLNILLSRIRDWNTNAKTSGVSQRVLNVLMRSYPAGRFVALAKARGVGNGMGIGIGMAQVWRGIEAYSERHFRRVEELGEESWVVEFTLGEMESVLGEIQARETVEEEVVSGEVDVVMA